MSAFQPSLCSRMCLNALVLVCVCVEVDKQRQHTKRQTRLAYAAHCLYLRDFGQNSCTNETNVYEKKMNKRKC